MKAKEHFLYICIEFEYIILKDFYYKYLRILVYFN